MESCRRQRPRPADPRGRCHLRDGPRVFRLRAAPPPASSRCLLRDPREIESRCRRIYSAPIDRTTGIICDQTISLNGHYSQQHYPDHLRRIRLRDAASAKTLVFLSNQFALPPITICALYKARWQVELFFKWVKQHLRIKRFFGTSENAVKSQIWIAVSVYVLVAIVKKRLNLDASLYTLLQILSLTLFEKMPILQALSQDQPRTQTADDANQLTNF